MRMVEGLKISGADAILDAIIGGRAVTLILVLREARSDGLRRLLAEASSRNLKVSLVTRRRPIPC